MTNRKLKASCVIFSLFLNILLLDAEEIKIYSDKTATTLRNPVV